MYKLTKNCQASIFAKAKHARSYQRRDRGSYLHLCETKLHAMSHVKNWKYYIHTINRIHCLRAGRFDLSRDLFILSINLSSHEDMRQGSLKRGERISSQSPSTPQLAVSHFAYRAHRVTRLVALNRQVVSKNSPEGSQGGTPPWENNGEGDHNSSSGASKRDNINYTPVITRCTLCSRSLRSLFLFLSWHRYKWYSSAERERAINHI